MHFTSCNGVSCTRCVIKNYSKFGVSSDHVIALHYLVPLCQSLVKYTDTILMKSTSLLYGDT